MKLLDSTTWRGPETSDKEMDSATPIPVTRDKAMQIMLTHFSMAERVTIEKLERELAYRGEQLLELHTELTFYRAMFEDFFED